MIFFLKIYTGINAQFVRQLATAWKNLVSNPGEGGGFLLIISISRVALRPPSFLHNTY